MPTIEFTTVYGDSSIFRPVMAKQHIPEWWKKSKVKEIRQSVDTETIRACPSCDDLVKTGWLIINNVDIHVNCLSVNKNNPGNTPLSDGDTTVWQAWVPPTNEYEPFSESKLKHGWYGTSQHPHYQNQPHESFFDGGKTTDSFKFRIPWGIKTPPGYSVQYMDPFLHTNRDFNVFPGIIDTDTFGCSDTTLVIVNPKVHKSFVIKKGTPILQIFPFKREKWVASYNFWERSSYLKRTTYDLSGDETTYPTETEIEHMGKPSPRCPWPNFRSSEISEELDVPYKISGSWKIKGKYFNDSNPHVFADNPTKQLELDL